MHIKWVSFFLVFRAMSSVMLAEIFLSYFFKGFRDWYAILFILSISIFLLIFTCIKINYEDK